MGKFGSTEHSGSKKKASKEIPSEKSNKDKKQKGKKPKISLFNTDNKTENKVKIKNKTIIKNYGNSNLDKKGSTKDQSNRLKDNNSKGKVDLSDNKKLKKKEEFEQSFKKAMEKFQKSFEGGLNKLSEAQKKALDQLGEKFKETLQKAFRKSEEDFYKQFMLILLAQQNASKNGNGSGNSIIPINKESYL